MGNKLKVTVRLCAWHRKYFSTDKCLGLDITTFDTTNDNKSEDFIISHGICPECREKVQKEMKKRNKA